MCLIPWERMPKSNPHELYRGDFGARNRAPNGRFWPQKVLFIFSLPSSFFTVFPNITSCRADSSSLQTQVVGGLDLV